MPKLQIIPLADISVSTENYRFEPQGSEKEAIDKMIENQGDKLYILAKDIIEHGLNPNEKIWVTPFSRDNTKFYVLEGNRRIVALKLLTLREPMAQMFTLEDRQPSPVILAH